MSSKILKKINHQINVLLNALDSISISKKKAKALFQKVDNYKKELERGQIL